MRKLLNKRGSVLFLVVVVMALLVVAASATYYVIRSQHASANIHYSSEQSYQTAYSVSEQLETYMTNLKSQIASTPSAYDGSLFQMMMEEMSEGDTITSENTNLTAYGLGDFYVEIKRVDSDSDESTESGTFEITTVAEVNGETVSITQVWVITLSPSETKYFTRFLTSTGYRDEDVYLTAINIYGDTYFENAFTSAGITAFQRSVYCAGNLVDNGVQFQDAMSTDELEIAVAGNYYIDSAAGGSMKFGALFVGGDFINGATSGGWSGKQIIVDNVYVLGNYTSNTGQEKATMFIQKNCYMNSGQDGATYYINGDLHINNNENSGGVNLNGASFYVKGNVYFHNDGVTNNLPNFIKCWGDIGVINDSKQSDADVNALVTAGEGAFPLETDMSTKSGGDFKNWNNVAQYIATKTARGTYNDWNVKDDRFGGKPAIKLDEVGVYGTDENEAKRSKVEQKNGGYFVTITENCTVYPALYWGWENDYILIDTTVYDDDIYIKLDPNGEVGDDGKPLFAFGLYNDWNGRGGAPNVSVLVKGSHSVVFVLPDNVTFSIGSNNFVGHLDVALALSGYNTVEDLYSAGTSQCLGNLLGNDAYASYADSVLGIMNNIQTDEIDEETGGYKTVYAVDPNSPVFNSLRSYKEANGEVFAPHNNIYLTATGKSNRLNFNAGNSPFCGYVYAPNVLLEIDNMSHGLICWGGLIVGSYYYYAYTGTLIYAEPYDPYNGHGSNVANDLMGLSGGAADGSSSSNDTSAEFLGYK